MSHDRRTWLTQATHDRLSSELAALESDDGVANPDFAHTDMEARQARIARIKELLKDAVVGEAPPDDGIAEPGMVLTVRYDGEDEPETFLLGVRDRSAEEELTVYSPESPLGQAIVGAKQGDQRSFQAPNGKTIRITLVSAQPYGEQHSRLAS